MAPVFTGNWFGFGKGPSGGGGTPYTPPNDPLGHNASGGVISEYTTPPGAVYRSHTFNQPGTFVVSALSESYPAHVEYVLVGGGGSGGGDRGGGGGGGGVRTNSPACEIGGPSSSKDPATNAPISTTSYGITVQWGGISGSYPQPANPTKTGDGTPANPGKPLGGSVPHTSAFGASVSGGGGAGNGGGGGPQGTAGKAMPGPLGGSAGGSVWPNWPSTSGGPYGWKGGEGDPGGALGAGGGGGATKEGDKGQSNSEGGEGGDGAECTMQGPNCEIELGAGGGGGDNGAQGGYGGSPTPLYPAGWGGAGFPDTLQTPQPMVPNATCYSGVSGSGGGGGGANNNAPVMNGGYGASGVCIVRYQIQASNKVKFATKATGGQVSYYNGKIIHTFLYNATFTTTDTITDAEVFIIGGGGGGAGGNGGSGGGGSGGAAKLTGVTFGSPAPFSITVGRGGRGGACQNMYGGDGQDSTITGPGPALTATITGKGGGGGAGWNQTDAQGRTGGCGGGSALASPNDGSGDTGGSTNQPTANPGWPGPSLTSYGNVGGAYGETAPAYRGGGGGGLGAAGHAGDASPDPSSGGIGIQLPSTFQDPRAANNLGVESTPAETWYWVGGGGAGGTETGNPTKGDTAGIIPIGGGGQAGEPGPFWRWSGTPGMANTGGGGGCGFWGPGSGGNGGDGATGLVLIAYPDPNN